MKILFTLILSINISPVIYAQACTPAGDETSYGTADTWIGYLYNNLDFTSYSGYTTEGTPGSPNFDESFGGDYVNYTTNGCPVYTETFSARYKLTKTFAPGGYQFIVGADDGYRLSLDGGATWVINHFNAQSYNFSAYSTTLSGTYSIVLEYFEDGGGNRISFSVANACISTGDQSIYGTGNVWNGYIYQGINFDTYSGTVTEGVSGNPDFTENFGGDNTLYTTSSCLVPTERFSARYRLQKTFASNSYTLTAGGDDGYRLSIDGGSTWVIDKWFDQGYNTSTYTAALAGTYNVVLEYYENSGGNQVSFSSAVNALLPVQLLSFDGKAVSKNISINWKVSKEVNTDYYLVERSVNGIDFSPLGKVYAGTVAASGFDRTYVYADPSPVNGINYYRLHMVDKDGKFSISPVIKIMFEVKKAVSVFPSVVNQHSVYLSTSSELKNGVVDMFEMTGRKLQEIKLPSLVTAGQTITLSLPVVPAGSYVLICKSGAAIKAKQIIIVR